MKMTPEEISNERGLSISTILGHIEKILKYDPSLAGLLKLPSAKDVRKISEAFAACKTEKLTPVFKKLKGAYPFETLRLVRAVETARNRLS